MTWKDLTLLQYENLKSLADTDRSRFANNAIEYLFGVKQPEVTLPLYEYSKYLKELQFFSEPMPKAKLGNAEWTLNGTTYKADLVIANFSAVQFMDWRTYTSQPNKSIIDLLSVVLVPEGHKYNDGSYDLEKAKDDIGTMSAVDANALLFFFANYFRIFVTTSLDSLRKKMKRMKKLPKDKVQEIVSKLEEMKTLVEQITT